MVNAAEGSTGHSVMTVSTLLPKQYSILACDIGTPAERRQAGEVVFDGVRIVVDGPWVGCSRSTRSCSRSRTRRVAS